MDEWPHMSRLERDIARIGIATVAAASLVGGAIGWVIGQLTHHLLHEGRSDHRR